MKYFYLITLLFLSINSFSQEETQKAIIVSSDSLNGKEIDVPFSIIEDIPLAPGCESVEKNKRMECFNVFMTEHIKKHFKYPNAAARKNIQGKVFVTFLIDKEGFVEKIETKGGHALLRKEAFRIIDKLPKFIPGYQKGKPVKVRYGLPITFRLTK